MEGDLARVVLSPNEEEKLLKDNTMQNRRKRMMEVREQEKLNAARLRREYQQQKAKQQDMALRQMKENWQADKLKEIEDLTTRYNQACEHIGAAHVAAENSVIEQVRSMCSSNVCQTVVPSLTLPHLPLLCHHLHPPPGQSTRHTGRSLGTVQSH